jgi:hypothetical protein
MRWTEFISTKNKKHHPPMDRFTLKPKNKIIFAFLLHKIIFKLKFNFASQNEKEQQEKTYFETLTWFLSFLFLLIFPIYLHFIASSGD